MAEAKVLLDNGCFHGAFYLAGYAVECALKARIAGATQAGDFPDKNKAAQCWKHDLGDLLAAADLATQLRADSTAHKDIGDNWAVARKWNESYRYDRAIDQKSATDLCAAISESPNGVLAWRRPYW